MRIQFKHKEYQEDAVNDVVDCFAGQPKVEGITYRLDPGKLAASKTQSELDYGTEAFRNAPIELTQTQLLDNIHRVQRRRNLPQSKELVATKNCAINLDVEMETGTGKTYVYIRTMLELNRRYGWSKFIIVVPSIATRSSSCAFPPPTRLRTTRSTGSMPLMPTLESWSKRFASMASPKRDSAERTVTFISNPSWFPARHRSPVSNLK